MADVSTLGIEIKSTGINPAVTALGKLAEQAVKVESSMKSMQAVLDKLSGTDLTKSAVAIRQLALALTYLNQQMSSIAKTSDSFKKVTTSLTAISTAAEKLSGSGAQFAAVQANLKGLQAQLVNMQGASTPISQLRAEIGLLQNNLRNVQASAAKGINVNTGTAVSTPSAASLAATSSVTKEAEKANNALYTMGRTAATVRNTVFNLMALGGVSELLSGIIHIADEMKGLQSRLALVTAGANELKTVQAALITTSNQTGMSIKSVSDVYTRLARSTENMGVSSGRLLTVTSGLAKALVISGGSAEEFDRAMVQLSQGLAAGTFRGQDFHSVAEQAPMVLAAMRKGFQELSKDGVEPTVGQLKKMADAGQLTTDKVFPALEAGTKSLNAMFDKMPLTVGRATTELKNNFSVMVSDIDKTTNSSAVLANEIKSLAEGFKDATPYVISFIEHLPTAAISLATVALGSFAINQSKVFVNFVKSSAATYADAVAKNAAAKAAVELAVAEVEATQATLARATAMAGTRMGVISVAEASAAATLATQGLTAAEAASTATTGVLATSLGILNKALMLVGGIPGLIVGAIMLIVSYWDDITEAIGGATKAQSTWLAQQGKLSSTSAYGDLAASQVAGYKTLTKLDTERASLIKEKASAEAMANSASGRAHDMAIMQLSTINKRLQDNRKEYGNVSAGVDSVTKKMQENIRVTDAANKQEQDNIAAQKEIARLYKPEPGKTKKKKGAGAELAAEKKEAGLEGQIEAYDREREALERLGPAEAYMNSHMTKAIELEKQAAVVTNASAKAHLLAQAALENRAGAALKALEQEKEYQKLNKEAQKTQEEFNVSSNEALMVKNLNSSKDQLIISNLKIEAELRKELLTINRDSLLTDQRKQELSEKAIRLANSKKKQASDMVDTSAASTAMAGIGNTSYIEKDAEAEKALADRAFEEKLTSIRDQFSKINGLKEEQRAQELSAEEAHQEALNNIDTQANSQRLQGQQLMLTSAATVTDQFITFLSKAGQENSALYKAMFIAQKAIAIAQAIVNTELAATAAEASAAILGPGAMAAAGAAARSVGYMSVGLIAATSAVEVAGKFAKGSAFDNGNVVNSPTAIGMSGNRAGLIGEAGPEAVMPLARGADGKLGIQASGKSGGGNTLNMGGIHVTVQGGDTSEETAKAVALMVDMKIRNTLVQERRQGGLLAN